MLLAVACSAAFERGNLVVYKDYIWEVSHESCGFPGTYNIRIPQKSPYWRILKSKSSVPKDELTLYIPAKDHRGKHSKYDELIGLSKEKADEKRLTLGLRRRRLIQQAE